MALNAKFNAIDDIFGTVPKTDKKAEPAKKKVATKAGASDALEHTKIEVEAPAERESAAAKAVVEKPAEEKSAAIETKTEMSVKQKSAVTEPAKEISTEQEVTIAGADSLELDITATRRGSTIPRELELQFGCAALRRGVSRDVFFTEILDHYYKKNESLTMTKIYDIIEKYNVPTVKKRITVTIPTYIANFIDSKAAEYGIKKNMLITHYIDEFLQENAET